MQVTLNKTEKQEFYRKLAVIAFPIVIQHVISIGLNIVDTLMIGRVGVNELAAVGSANQVYFIFTTLCFGLYSGAAVYTSQFWGVGDVKSIRKILGIDYVIGLSLSIFTILIALFFAPKILWIFSKDLQVITMGATYLRIACFSYLFAGMSFAISYNSRAIQRLKIPTMINACAITVNTVLNYCLIYGKFGFPRMSVTGAAIATLIARIVEFCLLVFYIYNSKNHPLGASLRELFHVDEILFKKVMRTAIPVVMTEGGWGISVALIFVAYGMLGASALAVVQVANVVSEFFQSVYFGVGNATAVILGESLGRGNVRLAKNHGILSMRITMLLNVVMTVVIIAIREPVAILYQFDSETTTMLMSALFVWGVTMTPKMISYLLICGILRAGGDTTFTMFVDLGGNLLIQMPLAFFGVLVLQWPLAWIIALVSVGDILKDILCYKRYRDLKWLNVLTEEAGQAETINKEN